MKILSIKIFSGDFHPQDHILDCEIIAENGDILLSEIHGDAYMEGYKGNAPSLWNVKGNAYFNNWEGSAPRLQYITESAYFSFWKYDAPELLEIGGLAEFSFWKGKALSLYSAKDLKYSFINIDPKVFKKVNEIDWTYNCPIANNIYLNTTANQMLNRNTSIFNIFNNYLIEESFITNNFKTNLALIIPILKLVSSDYTKLNINGNRGLVKLANKVLENNWALYEKIDVHDLLHLKSNTLRKFCFSYLRPTELMKLLGAERVEVAGIEMNYYRYDENGLKLPYSKYNIYETYHTTKHGEHDIPELFAVKCWCTTTENEHWIFIQERYVLNPLAAIASTFHLSAEDVRETKCLKRQGDILIAEFKESENEPSTIIKLIIQTGDSSYKLVDSIPLDESNTKLRQIKENVFESILDFSSHLTSIIENSRDLSLPDYMPRPLSPEVYFSLLECET